MIDRGGAGAPRAARGLRDTLRAKDHARHRNRVRVFEALLGLKQASRAELVAASGLSRATLGEVLIEAMDAGLVRGGAQDVETRRVTGRPAHPIGVVADAALLIGVDVGDAWITCAVCELEGRRVVTHRVAVEPERSLEATLELVGAMIDTALAEASAEWEQLVGVGIALATQVERQSGDSRPAAELDDWDGAALGPALEHRLGLPVRVESRARAAAIGEHRFGAGRGYSHVMYLSLSEVIGLGMILDNRPYAGADGVAGEIGHITVVADGLICRCGSRGCLESVAGAGAVCELVERSRGEAVSVSRLLELLDAGDRGVHTALAGAGDAVGRVVAGAVNLLNPQVVILGGELARAGEVVLRALRRATNEATIARAAASTRFVVGELGADAEVIGAAGRLLDQAPEALAHRLA